MSITQGRINRYNEKEALKELEKKHPKLALTLTKIREKIIPHDELIKASSGKDTFADEADQFLNKLSGKLIEITSLAFRMDLASKNDDDWFPSHLPEGKATEEDRVRYSNQLAALRVAGEDDRERLLVQYLTEALGECLIGLNKVVDALTKQNEVSEQLLKNAEEEKSQLEQVLKDAESDSQFVNAFAKEKARIEKLDQNIQDAKKEREKLVQLLKSINGKRNQFNVLITMWIPAKYKNALVEVRSKDDEQYQDFRKQALQTKAMLLAFAFNIVEAYQKNQNELLKNQKRLTETNKVVIYDHIQAKVKKDHVELESLLENWEEEVVKNIKPLDDASDDDKAAIAKNQAALKVVGKAVRRVGYIMDNDMSITAEQGFHQLYQVMLNVKKAFVKQNNSIDVVEKETDEIGAKYFNGLVKFNQANKKSSKQTDGKTTISREEEHQKLLKLVESFRLKIHQTSSQAKTKKFLGVFNVNGIISEQKRKVNNEFAKNFSETANVISDLQSEQLMMLDNKLFEVAKKAKLKDYDLRILQQILVDETNNSKQQFLQKMLGCLGLDKDKNLDIFSLLQQQDLREMLQANSDIFEAGDLPSLKAILKNLDHEDLCQLLNIFNNKIAINIQIKQDLKKFCADADKYHRAHETRQWGLFDYVFDEQARFLLKGIKSTMGYIEGLAQHNPAIQQALAEYKKEEEISPEQQPASLRRRPSFILGSN